MSGADDFPWGDDEDMVDHSWEGDEDMLAMMDNPDQVLSLFNPSCGGFNRLSLGWWWWFKGRGGSF